MKRKNDLNFYFSYSIYELNALTIAKIKKIQKISKKSSNFVKENIIFEKIQKLVILLCSYFEKLLYYKSLKNSNSKLLFTCEDIINPLIHFVNKGKELRALITRYANANVFEHSIEIRFILLYFSKLFNLPLENKTLIHIYKGKEIFPSFSQIKEGLLDSKSFKPNYMILFLNSDNKFIIRYISTEIVESLGYLRNDLIENELTDSLIPKVITSYHNIYMKNFILMGYSFYKKKTFVMNKENQLVPFVISCKILPMIDALYSMIVELDKIPPNNCVNYHVILNMSYNILCISEAFESQFFFSLKMLNMLKINFCDFFGVNKEKLSVYYRQYCLIQQQVETPKSISNHLLFLP